MMPKRTLLARLLLVAAAAACCALPPPLSASDDRGREGRELISEGLGIRGVYLWRSTADNVAAAYGKEFELIEHGAHSVEMRYAALDLSFYYCKADARKRVFHIECRAPFNGFTARGIVLGESTVRDVFKAYGATDPSTSHLNEHWTFRYPGIEFTIPYKKTGVNPLAGLLGEKITEVGVITDRWGSDCIPPNLERAD